MWGLAIVISEPLQGHGPASPGGISWATVGGLVQVGDKAQKWGIPKCEDTMSLNFLKLCEKMWLILAINS